MRHEAADLECLTEACGRIEPTAGAEALRRCIQDALRPLEVRRLSIDDEWYRLGGVVTADGDRVAESLYEWADAESGGDALELLARYGDAGYCATAISGRTHYFIAAQGPGPLEFLQVEVDEIQEVVERPLFDPDRIPDTLEDVIDPLGGVRLPPRPLAPPRYVFRRAVDWSGRFGELTSEFTGDPRFRRFLEEWERSSASVHGARFCDHWALTVVPYLDSLGDHKQEVRPLTPDAHLVADFVRTPEFSNGPALAARMRRIDHAAGYDMAWYFLMLTRNYLPYEAVGRLRAAFAGSGGVAYLPARDLDVLAHWIEEPYHLQPCGPVAGSRAA